MRFLLDTNVIVDILSKRQPFFQNSYDCLASIFSKNFSVCITASCVTDIVYILRKYISDKKALFSSVENFLDLVYVLDTKYSTVKHAFAFSMKDYEDAVILQCAMENGIDMIITRNKKDFLGSSVQVMTPDELLFFWKNATN